MNVSNQKVDITRSLDTALTQQPQSSAAPDDGTVRFGSMMREKHEGTAGKTDKTENQPEAEAKEEPVDTGNGKLTDEQYLMIAAMTMQPRPEITFVQPEQTEEAVVTVTADVLVAEDAAPAAELQTAPAETVETAVEAAVETGERPVEAAPQQKTEAPQTVETADQRPVEAPVQNGQMQRAAQTEARPEAQETEQTELRPEAQPRVHVTRREEAAKDVPAEKIEPLFAAPEAMPVKVAEPEAPVALEAPEAPEQISRKVLEGVENGRDMVEIQLAPEGLGKLNVVITRTETGALNVALHAVSPRANSLLQQHVDGLQNALAASVKTEVRVQAGEPQNSDRQFMDPNGEHSRQQQPRQQHEQKHSESRDFVQKLRLGLTELNPEQ